MLHSRRTFLRGIAATLALPSLEAFGQIAPVAKAGAATAANPLRMAFVYAPNGVNVAKWFPSGTGKDYQLGESLAALQHLRNDFQIIGGLDQNMANANGDGGGDHARANATFLTGCQPRKTAGADIQLGVSVDQIAAEALGARTRLPSLELSTDEARRSGGCDSGYSCAYQFNLSWRSDTTPAPPERDPRLVFEQLFGSGNNKMDGRRRAYQQSVLDFVMQDAANLQRKASGADKAKLDEYFTSVREIEQRIARAEKFRATVPEVDSPNGVPESYAQHIRTMYDLLALSFQTDITRVSTFLLAHDGSVRSFPEIGVREGHHSLSHHKGNEANLEQIAKIDAFYSEQFAYFLDKLAATREADGSRLLDNTMIVYAAGIRDGNRHDHADLPVILAGGGGGTLQNGRHFQAPKGTPMTNLYLSLLDRMNVPVERIGDSTGRLAGI
jgi:hypothetical protein